MGKEYQQQTWNAQLIADSKALVELAITEDLGGMSDWTSVSIVGVKQQGLARLVAREKGIVAGLQIPPLVIKKLQADLVWKAELTDGDRLSPGQVLGTLQGSGRDLLTAERTILNFIGRLSGIASLTDQYIQALNGVKTKLYDTRKTTPGWRRLEKYAVRCGGGTNHRTGLFEAMMIKDNHIAMADSTGMSLVEALLQARAFLQNPNHQANPDMILEVEVDTLKQFAEILPHQPDIILLDNMSPEQMREAVTIRDKTNSQTELEASGGISLKTIQEKAASGVDRISVGGLTHSARILDIGLDWGRS